MRAEWVCSYVKNDRLGLRYKMNISKPIFQHFLREPMRSRAQNFQKNLDFKKLKVFKIFETNTFSEKRIVGDNRGQARYNDLCILIQNVLSNL
jgi:hypothetical protein